MEDQKVTCKKLEEMYEFVAAMRFPSYIVSFCEDNAKDAKIPYKSSNQGKDWTNGNSRSRGCYIGNLSEETFVSNNYLLNRNNKFTLYSDKQTQYHKGIDLKMNNHTYQIKTQSYKHGGKIYIHKEWFDRREADFLTSVDNANGRILTHRYIGWDILTPPGQAEWFIDPEKFKESGGWIHPIHGTIMKIIGTPS
jgi:hypothetical protein